MVGRFTLHRGKFLSNYSFDESGVTIGAELNTQDKKVLDEEQAILKLMSELRAATDANRIKDIPDAELIKHGIARIHNSKRFILFKQLQSGKGPVIYHD